WFGVFWKPVAGNGSCIAIPVMHFYGQVQAGSRQVCDGRGKNHDDRIAVGGFGLDDRLRR
ncbi:MAG: hypothetical protein ACXV8Q_14870, partial [Methylobacter sp.]